MDFRIKKIQLEQIDSTQNNLKQIIFNGKFNEENKNNLKLKILSTSLTHQN